MQNQTLLERIGGPQLLATVVDKFYDKIVADDLVKGFYKGIDMAKLRT
jgi:hemoglobin